MDEDPDHRRTLKSHKNRPGPDDPWQVTVDVFLNSVGPDGTPDFDIQTCLPTKPCTSKPTHPEIQFDNAGREAGFQVRFRFFDNTNGGNGSKYRFPLTPQDGVWSQLGAGCPTDAVYDIFPKDCLDVQDKGLTLVASNPNPGPPPGQGPFGYTLNVSIGGTSPYVHLDPVGNNTDGGSGFYEH